MKTVLISNSGASASWTADQDYLLTGVIAATSTSNKVLLSFNPTAVPTDVDTPSATFSADEFIIYLRSTTTLNPILENLEIPIDKGRQIFAAFSTLGSVILLLQESAEIGS